MMLLLASVTGVYAESADGVLSVNVMNAIQGYTGGRMDIVLNNANTKDWYGFQFDIVVPEGVTITGYEEGELFDGHTFTSHQECTDHPGKMLYAAANISETKKFKAKQGTLMTILFSVAAGAQNGTISLSTISLSDASGASAVDYTVADFETPFTIDNTTFTLDENARSWVAPSGTYNVTVKRKLKANVWNTICLPFDILKANFETIFGAGTEVAEFTGATYTTHKDGKKTVCTDIKVNFTKEIADDQIYAGYPYLIKVTEEKDIFSVNSVSSFAGVTEDQVSSPEGQGKMSCSFVPTNVPSGSLYISNNQFKYSGGNATIKGLRGYLTLNYTLDGYASDNPASRNIKFDIDGENTTGIFNLEEGTVEKENKYFNLHGQRVLNPTKGVYIVKGKKVMFK